MTTWTSDELSRIEAADELRIEPRRGDGTLGKPYIDTMVEPEVRATTRRLIPH